ncbi:MAG: RraA family protein, partial [Chloroflexota bacterium]|nr:RraA family protein [Chloroflexota bacterium]
VLDGYSRDTAGILNLGFPTFSYGGYAQDQGVRGRVIDYRVPIEIGDTRVSPGDIIFGDRDGVCIIPHAAADEVVALALDKVRGENLVRKALDDGLSAEAAFQRFGIM